MAGEQRSWKPNLFVPGFPKCGTTALCDYLKQNPAIYMMEPKEPNTLAEGELIPAWGSRHLRLMRPYYSVLGFRAYRRQFERHADARYRAEGSQNYIFPRRFPRKLKEFSPRAKLLFMIREQKSRLVSMYFYLYTEHREPDFRRWVSERVEPEIGKFLYSERLSSFYHVFGDSMRVVGGDALQRSPQQVMDAVSDFLGVTRAEVTPIQSNVGELKSLSPEARAIRSGRDRFVRDVRTPVTYLWNTADPGRGSPFLNRLFQLHPLRKVMKRGSEQVERPRRRRIEAVPEESLIPKELAAKLDEDYAQAYEFCRSRSLMIENNG
ncbi:MAG: sulfotransferase [Nitrososphaerota archaeon]|nr:sulfotransferase [Nitrososphaerota archaeon]